MAKKIRQKQHSKGCASDRFFTSYQSKQIQRPAVLHLALTSVDGMVGTMFLRYHEEIVDCGKPERSAS